MAKKGKKQPVTLESMMNVTPQQFQQYLRGQRGQYTPTIKTLRNQMAVLRRKGDPMVKAYERLLGGVPSEEAVSGAYDVGLQNVAGYLQGLDMARGGRGVSDIVAAVGGTLGVEGAGDVAQAAGTVSGIGEAGGDVMSKALLAQAAAQFAGAKTERLGQLAEQRQALTMGAAEARKGAREQRMELGRMLAEVRGQRRGAAPNPFDVANMIMQYQQNLQAMRGYGGGGYGASGGADGGAGGADPQEVAYRRQSIGAGLQGLITPAGMRPSAPGTITEFGAILGDAYTPSTIVQGPMAGTGYRAPVGAPQGQPTTGRGPRGATRVPTSSRPTRRPGTPMGGRSR